MCMYWANRAYVCSCSVHLIVCCVHCMLLGWSSRLSMWIKLILSYLILLGKVKQHAKFQHRISVHHAVMQICISHRLTIICAQNGFLGVLRVEMWKYCVLTPKRHYPAWIRVSWCIACQNRFNGLSSRSVKIFLRTKKEIKKIEC